MPLRAVIFDLGDTLWEIQWEERVWPIVREQIAARLAVAGQSAPEAQRHAEGFRQALGAVLADSWPAGEHDQHVQEHLCAYTERTLDRMGLPGTELAWTVCEAFFEVEHADGRAAVDDETLEMLGALKERGLLVGLVSNTFSPGHSLQMGLHRSGAARLIDLPVYSSDVACRKPGRRIYEQCLSGLAVAPEDALFVGDRLREDVWGPQQVGMRAALYQRFRQEVPTEQVQPELLISSQQELVAEVDRLLVETR
ncbi:MAG: HAD family hydrolase [Dehalococcoidia bacterium]